MKEKLTPYLRALEHLDGIRQQYAKPAGPEPLYSDPLEEEVHEVVQGLVHKYPNRALIKVSYRCASHCRFCTRARQIGDPSGDLQQGASDAIVEYLRRHPEIDDVILSGGDPLYTPSITIELLDALSSIESIKVFRIGTRLPLQLPAALKRPALQVLRERINIMVRARPFFILLHINHPDELSVEAMEGIRMLQETGAILLSQSVFLAGINDNADTLFSLFQKIFHAGVVPYYIYHCDAVAGLERFTVPLETEAGLMRELHRRLSGIAVPRHVADISGGKGKVPVNSGFWTDDQVYDFDGKIFPIPG